ncbi:Zinc finger CCHC domain-containing protein 8-like protein, partial [Frankliniella fusca]
MDESPGSSGPNLQEEGELSNDADCDDLFVVDSTPSVAKSYRDTPVYDTKFSEVLQVKKKEDVDSKPKRARAPQNSCWNCNGEHSLRECPSPRDYDAINRNRVIFMSKQGPRPKASRYHLDEEQKFPHIVAGRISKKLQRALGLQRNQLPRHIYRMRMLGYPPGWVEEAKVTHSGLTLFDSQGEEVAESGFEQGEIPAQGAKDKFDFKKIVEYPGFNCPCGPDIIDETERLNSKPIAERDSIKFMKNMWQGKAVTAYKRRKMNTSDSSSTPGKHDKRGSLLLLDDMELDSEDGASSDDEGEVKGNGAECSSTSAQGDEMEVPSPSTPLKAVKRNRPHSPESLDSKRLKVDETAEHNSDEDNENSSQNLSSTYEDPTPATPVVEQNTSSTSAPSTPIVGSVTSVSLGTPVLVRSEFTSLPSADKFAKNICDVINFENLPDSTGKYEKMSGLIKK